MNLPSHLNECGCRFFPSQVPRWEHSSAETWPYSILVDLEMRVWHSCAHPSSQRWTLSALRCGGIGWMRLAGTFKRKNPCHFSLMRSTTFHFYLSVLIQFLLFCVLGGSCSPWKLVYYSWNWNVDQVVEVSFALKVPIFIHLSHRKLFDVCYDAGKLEQQCRHLQSGTGSFFASLPSFRAPLIPLLPHSFVLFIFIWNVCYSLKLYEKCNCCRIIIPEYLYS
jgi:hypothetical protein